MIEPSETFLPYMQRTEEEITVLDMGWIGSRNTGVHKGVIVSEPEVSTDSGRQTDILPGEVDLDTYTGNLKQEESFWYLVRSNYVPGERQALGYWRNSDLEVYDIPEDERQQFRSRYNGQEGFYSSEDPWLDYFRSLF